MKLLSQYLSSVVAGNKDALFRPGLMATIMAVGPGKPTSIVDTWYLACRLEDWLEYSNMPELRKFEMAIKAMLRLAVPEHFELAAGNFGGDTWWKERSCFYRTAAGAGLEYLHGGRVRLLINLPLVQKAAVAEPSQNAAEVAAPMLEPAKNVLYMRYGCRCHFCGELNVIRDNEIGAHSINAFEKCEHYSRAYARDGEIYCVFAPLDVSGVFKEIVVEERDRVRIDGVTFDLWPLADSLESAAEADGLFSVSINQDGRLAKLGLVKVHTRGGTSASAKGKAVLARLHAIEE